MLTLLWSEKALEELDSLIAYVGERNQPAADSLLERIEFVAERLTEFPYMHRAGRIPGTREAVISPNYLVVYRVTLRTIEVLNVLHTRQQYP